MNELYLFAPSALIAAGMGGWGLKSWYSARKTKAALLQKLDEDMKALEDLMRQNSNAQAAADAATLQGLQERFKSL